MSSPVTYKSKVEFYKEGSTQTSTKKSKHHKAKKTVTVGPMSSSFTVKGTYEPYRVKVKETDNKIVATCTSKLHPQAELKIVEKKGKQKKEVVHLKKKSDTYKNMKSFTLEQLEKFKNFKKPFFHQ